jgi:hypothetical protein
LHFYFELVLCTLTVTQTITPGCTGKKQTTKGVSTMAEITNAALKACADEMNTVMGLDPKIKMVAVKSEVLIQAIINNACGIAPDGTVTAEDGIQETDVFANTTWRVLNAILDAEDEAQAFVAGIAAAKVADMPPLTESQTKKKVADEASEKEQETKAVVRKQQSAELKAAKAEAKAKAAAERQANRKRTRSETFRDIILSGPKTMEELNAEMVAAYGGSEKEAAFQNYNFCRILIDMGFLVKAEDGKYNLAE